MEVKYLDKVKICPNCRYRIRNKYGRKKFFKSLERAIHYAYPRNNFVEIIILNDEASDAIPDDTNFSIKESKDILSVNAKTRVIYLDKDKTRIIFEYFELNVPGKYYTNNYEYDYDILYDESAEFIKDDSVVSCDVYPFSGRMIRVYGSIRVFGIENVCRKSRDEVLNVIYPGSCIFLRYWHYDNDTIDEFVPFYMMKYEDDSNLKIREFVFPDDIDYEKEGARYSANGKSFTVKFIKNKSFYSGGFYTLVSDDDEVSIYSSLDQFLIKDMKTGLKEAVYYIKEYKDGKVHLIPYYFPYEKAEE